VIWLVARRYRVLIAVTTLVLVALGIWMLLAGQALQAAESSLACRHDTFQCHVINGVFSLSDQAIAINFLLLFVPCLLGIVFGAPLVAGELEHYTNRLAWTQGISRTRWLLVKWFSIGLILVVLVTLLTLVSQWWTGHAVERIAVNLSGLSTGRLQPLYFPVTGLAMCAYTLFAFALGAALGAVLRKSSWAIVGTVVIYTGVSVLMLLLVRPSLAPQTFLPFPTAITPAGQQSSGTYGAATSRELTSGSWNLGSGYRFAPGSHETGPSAADDAQHCQAQNYNYSPYLACLSAHRVQAGTFYQAGTHYWDLQWRESALLVATAGALLGLTVWSVRKWRA
jgi:putative Mn2+ efflux pump MntP